MDCSSITDFQQSTAISIAKKFRNLHIGKSKTIFFPSNTLIYGISRDSSKNFNIRTCEHMILGQLRMGARQAKNAPLMMIMLKMGMTMMLVRMNGSILQ